MATVSSYTPFRTKPFSPLTMFPKILPPKRSSSPLRHPPSERLPEQDDGHEGEVGADAEGAQRDQDPARSVLRRVALEGGPAVAGLVLRRKRDIAFFSGKLLPCTNITRVITRSSCPEPPGQTLDPGPTATAILPRERSLSCCCWSVFFLPVLFAGLLAHLQLARRRRWLTMQ